MSCRTFYVAKFISKNSYVYIFDSGNFARQSNISHIAFCGTRSLCDFEQSVNTFLLSKCQCIQICIILRIEIRLNIIIATHIPPRWPNFMFILLLNSLFLNSKTFFIRYSQQDMTFINIRKKLEKFV